MEQPNNFDRREFLARLGKAGVLIAAIGAVSGKLYDRKGHSGIDDADIVRLKDFSVKPVSGQTMGIALGADRAKNAQMAVAAIGGMQRFVKKGDIVAIKPNVAFASPAILGATANPELVAAVVRMCYEVGAKKVIVTDNPINDPANCFMISGIGIAAEKAGAKIFLPKKSAFALTSVDGGRLIQRWPILYEPLGKIDKLIGISPVKNHNRSGASMAMKNWYGLLGGQRNVFHQDINGIIAELSMMVKPTLVILDGVDVMSSNGPTGGSISDLKRTNTLIASCDMVAADSFGCSLLGLKPNNLPYLRQAEKAGAGTTDYESLNPNFVNA
ncbi:MAG: DUF362 domain-containing protein [Phycisphaerae bacterium]|nr:DUF362 domain-containing protein [Phycisphaerae bacterium]